MTRVWLWFGLVAVVLFALLTVVTEVAYGKRCEAKGGHMLVSRTGERFCVTADAVLRP